LLPHAALTVHMAPRVDDITERKVPSDFGAGRGGKACLFNTIYPFVALMVGGSIALIHYGKVLKGVQSNTLKKDTLGMGNQAGSARCIRRLIVTILAATMVTVHIQPLVNG